VRADLCCLSTFKNPAFESTFVLALSIAMFPPQKAVLLASSAALAELTPIFVLATVPNAATANNAPIDPIAILRIASPPLSDAATEGHFAAMHPHSVGTGTHHAHFV
jgi:hypothetical protein